jgi:RNA 3'-terminal phosphate cyclase (ATP)
MLDLDGGAYSGSGTLVRQAVAYAAITRTAIRIHNVRSRRPRPGLRPQHLCGVEAVRSMVGGTVYGASVGSGEFSFRPGERSPRGAYRFDVGTAGSATALCLALLPVLATAGEPVHAELVGGLFQDHAPSPFHLQHVLVPLLARMGLTVSVAVVRPGYVPTGGGLLHLDVQPGAVAPLEMERREALRGIWGVALSSHLRERQVSARMARSAHAVLAAAGFDANIEERDDTTAAQPGAGLALFANLADGSRIGADGAGAPGRRAERIGTATAHRLLEDLRSGATLDRFASDQIIIFAALARGRTRVRLAAVTEHVRTGLWLAELFGVASTRLEDRLLTINGGRARPARPTETGGSVGSSDRK